MAAKSNAQAAESDWVALPCVCANVRRLARLATRVYDDQLRACHMEIGQVALLATIRRSPGVSQARLSHGLGMESTSLTRTLAVMRKRGWIEKHRGTDRRSRVFSVTAAGERQFARARPYWDQAQQRFASVLGVQRVQSLAGIVEEASLALNDYVSAATREQRSRGRRAHTQR